MLPVDFGWSDIGSWKSLYDFLPKDQDANVIDGDIIVQNTRDSFILGHERLIAVNNLRNIAVIETPDSVFVSDLEGSREVKSIVSRLKEGDRKEYQHHRTQYFPWGSKTLLERETCYKVERLIVYPKSSLSLQKVEGRTFRIVILKGLASLRGAGQEKQLSSGEVSDISWLAPPVIENRTETELVFLLIETEIN